MEYYKVIEGFENYSVSNFGDVKINKTNKVMISTFDKDGYKSIKLSKDGKRFNKRVHRLVAEAFIPNPENKPVVDHINNVYDDNNAENLRWATRSENQYNQTLQTKSTSGFKGVTFHKASGKWRAVIVINKKNIHLGSFETKEEAIEARVMKAFEVFG